MIITSRMRGQTKKSRMSFEQHQELGEYIKQARHKLMALYGATRGMSVRHPLNKDIFRATEALDRLRCDFEDQMYIDFREKASTGVYYGPFQKEKKNP